MRDSSRGLRIRTLFGLVAATAVLTACEITASGSGTVTITSDNPATTYDSGTRTGSIAWLCAQSSTQCRPIDPYLYTYYPSTGVSEWIVAPGFPVINQAGDTVGLPPGIYTLQVSEYNAGNYRMTNAIEINVFTRDDRDLTIWHQSYARESGSVSCAKDWAPSWSEWPHGGSGGFVCNRKMYAYYPDVSVP